MKEAVPNLKKKRIDFNGGLDEYSPVADVPLSDAIEMENWRLSKDGKRTEKRLGLEQEVTDFGEDLYGYATYYDSDSAYCQLAVLESQIKRKVGAGSWTSIHSFSSNISHPVKILAVQGKLFIINETDSRMIHTDKADYQIGITKPAGNPASKTEGTSTAGGNQLTGKYLYAITYARSGNYGCESNPMTHTIGTTVHFVGSGLDDLTIGGDYSGTASPFTFSVKIDATGTPDTITYSYDGQSTWLAIGIPITTTMYLPQGITLTWGATTGHDLNDVWNSAIFTIAGVHSADDKYVAIAKIPVSADAQVDQRKIYRTLLNGARYYWAATLNNNTTTTYKDNHLDSYLGSRVGEDKDILPNGKFSEWWDNRLWVADADDNIVYYSEIDYPEEFDTDVRYITFRQQFVDDEITGMVAFRDALYVFKRKAVYVVLKQSGGTYGRYLIETDVGCVAPWSIVNVNNTLMFLSYRGWEVYNGYEATPMRLSVAVDRTIKAIDTSKYDYITSVHVVERSEVWLCLPDSNVTVVYNYMRGKFYLFSFYKVPSCLVECRNSSKALVVKMGTRDGFLCLTESTYRDHTTAITATIRKPWIEAEKYANVRYLETEFEMPADMTLTMNIYVNFQKTVARTKALAGSTPTATDIELRRPIRCTTELGQRAKYFCVEYVNAENLGGDLKLNKAYLYYAPTVMKGDISGD